VPALEARGDSELFLDGGLQTGGLGVVVSFRAVGDLDVHASASFPARSLSGCSNDNRRRESADSNHWVR
jgi:hypothetical protein